MIDIIRTTWRALCFVLLLLILATAKTSSAPIEQPGRAAAGTTGRLTLNRRDATLFLGSRKPEKQTAKQSPKVCLP